MDRPPCKACSQPDTRRIPRQGIVEVALSLLFYYPYRCQSCSARFVSFQRGKRFDEAQIDRRQLDRTPVRVDAVAVNTEHGRFSVCVTDLTATGCQLSSDIPLSVGEEFDLSLYLVPQEAPVHVLGAVVRDRENNSYGLTFRQIGAMEWHIVRRYLVLQQGSGRQ